MILRILISVVFLAAGILKLRDPLAFSDGIAAFQIFPAWIINPMAMVLPYFEILTGLGNLSVRARSAAALAACGLSACFVVLYASALVRGLDVTCGCFGKWEILQASTRVGFVRAVVLLGLSVWIYRACRKNGGTAAVPSQDKVGPDRAGPSIDPETN